MRVTQVRISIHLERIKYVAKQNTCAPLGGLVLSGNYLGLDACLQPLISEEIGSSRDTNE
jgi:hypothetical protein